MTVELLCACCAFLLMSLLIIFVRGKKEAEEGDKVEREATLYPVALF